MDAELFLKPGLTIIHGDNGNGKSNLLEAIYILAWGKSQRTGNDKDLIMFANQEQDSPDIFNGVHTKVAASIERIDGSTNVQIDLLKLDSKQEPKQRPYYSNLTELSQKLIKKNFRVNGVNRRISDLIGEINAVLFTAQDLELVYGTPKLRRRYIDMLISQHNREYLKTLQRYQRSVIQRNHLLRSIKRGSSKTPELKPWDEHIANDGGYIIYTRSMIIGKLSKLCLDQHNLLSPQNEKLNLIYSTQVVEKASEHDKTFITQALQEKLSTCLDNDLTKGFTSVGPHRDDFQLTINDFDSARFASRGQTRLAVLSLKLAEAQYLSEERGENPLLLLDDVLSELDPVRRNLVLNVVSKYEQSVITTSEIENIPEDYKSKVRTYQICKGKIKLDGNI